MNLNKSIKEFKSVIPSINQKYRPYAEQVINLFKDRKIEKRIEAEKLLEEKSLLLELPRNGSAQTYGLYDTNSGEVWPAGGHREGERQRWQLLANHVCLRAGHRQVLCDQIQDARPGKRSPA